MLFELWDTDTGNIVNTYPTREAALAVVRKAIATYGREYVESWALSCTDCGEDEETILEGAALAERALKIVPA